MQIRKESDVAIMTEEIKKPLKQNIAESPEARAEFIKNTESGMYVGKNEDGEAVTVMLEQGVGMDIWTNQSNGWVRVDDYGVNGYKQSEAFEGRWDKQIEE